MRNYLFVILLLLICCKTSEEQKEIIPKDETLDLKYEVLNQLIKNDSMTADANRFIYTTKLFPARINKDINEPKPLGVDLQYDSIFLENDSAYYKNQEKIDLSFRLNKSKIRSKSKCIEGQELQKMHENKISDFWTEFYKKYENKCIKSYSVPFFNKDKTMCVVQNSTSCGILDAAGYTALYKKKSMGSGRK
ncbi:hypothetical protein ACFOEQ_18355 [Chryseobacterium arachidis]|uniref:hypothetical protein n=1 Tax=Chryseobacterium arachidis TaxID=1416778 RepID=UPI003620CC4A